MSDLFSQSLGLHAAALKLRETRNELLATNIANAATPHFKARDIDFASALNDAMAGGRLDRTAEGHMAPGGPNGATVLYRTPTTASLDGNTVELSVEQMEFAENTVRYQASLTLLNRRISGLMTAIKGE